MSKLFWNVLKLSPAILGATLLMTNRSLAAETSVAELAPEQPAAVTSAPNLSTPASAAAFEIASGKKIAAAAPQTDAQQPAAITNQPSQDTSATDVIAQVNSVDQLSNAEDSLSQVTSVSQFADVEPTDWAFQALQALVERYGCIAGYPDGTYRGNRALTRYEFAAGVYACLERINELIATATADLVTKEDLVVIQRLQEEFSAELATLRGRTDALEARTAELEANQFSTTTKLGGEVIFAPADVLSDERALPFGLAEEDLAGLDLAALDEVFENVDELTDEELTAAITASGIDIGQVFDAEDTGEAAGNLRRAAALLEGAGDLADLDEDIEGNTVFAYRARLNFNTSFTGRDLLRVRLQSGNVPSFGFGTTGTNMARLGFDVDTNNEVEIDDLFYRFYLSDALLVQIDAANVEFNDNVFTFNPVFESSGTGAISRYGRFSPIYRQGSGGTGLTLSFNPNGPFTASVGYLSPNGENTGLGEGLFNGAYAALAQVAFRPSDAFAVGLTYARTYYNQESGINLFSSTGSLLANRPFGNYATTANHYGVEALFRPSSALAISGWVGYTDAEAEAGPFAGDDASIWYWAASLALSDFGRQGNVLGVIFGQPPKLADSDFAQDTDTTYHLEALYRFRLTDNIYITPGVIVLFNPEHNSDNDDIYVGTLRTTFTF